MRGATPLHAAIFLLSLPALLYGLAAAAALLAAAVLVGAGTPARALVVRVALVLVAVTVTLTLGVAGETIARPLPGPLKATDIENVRELARWDPLARIDVGRIGVDGDPSHYAFLIDERYDRPRPPSLVMLLDMGAATPIVRAAPNDDLGVLEASILAAPYDLAPRRSVLVVGPGGGIDMQVALRHGATSVSAVEVSVIGAAAAACYVIASGVATAERRPARAT